MGFLFNFLLGFFSLFIPKNKDLFVIGAREGNEFAENSKYLYLHSAKKIKNLFG